MKEKILSAFIRVGNLKYLIGEQLKNQRGAGTVEYALVVAVIVVGIIGAATFMFDPLQDFFEGVVDKIAELAGV